MLDKTKDELIEYYQLEDPNHSEDEKCVEKKEEQECSIGIVGKTKRIHKIRRTPRKSTE